MWFIHVLSGITIALLIQLGVNYETSFHGLHPAIATLTGLVVLGLSTLQVKINS